MFVDTELKAAQDYDIFLRMVVEYGEPWKWKKRHNSAYQSR
ncbi:hypothetical protein ACLK1T_23835 [Escherichia coli]